MKNIMKLIMLVIISASIYAKDINVGDLITLSIDGSSKEEIQEAFHTSKLELDSIEKKDNGYIVRFRSFNVGETPLLIGNKKLIIDTKSVITKDDKEIYPNLSDKSDEKLYNIKFPGYMVVAGLIGAGSLIYLISGMKFKKREKELSPEEKFQRRLENISDETWPFDVSIAIRKYIDSVLNTHFTSGIYKPAGPVNQDDIDFLLFLDNYKFSGKNDNIKDESITKIKKIHDKLRGEPNEL